VIRQKLESRILSLYTHYPYLRLPGERLQPELRKKASRHGGVDSKRCYIANRQRIGLVKRVILPALHKSLARPTPTGA
jgi:hypothetical protein